MVNCPVEEKNAKRSCRYQKMKAASGERCGTNQGGRSSCTDLGPVSTSLAARDCVSVEHSANDGDLDEDGVGNGGDGGMGTSAGINVLAVAEAEAELEVRNRPFSPSRTLKALFNASFSRWASLSSSSVSARLMRSWTTILLAYT